MKNIDELLAEFRSADTATRKGRSRQIDLRMQIEELDRSYIKELNELVGFSADYLKDNLGRHLIAFFLWTKAENRIAYCYLDVALAHLMCDAIKQNVHKGYTGKHQLVSVIKHNVYVFEPYSQERKSCKLVPVQFADVPKGKNYKEPYDMSYFFDTP